MAQGKASFRHDSLQDSKSIQEILKSLSSGLGNGKITFADQDGRIVMKPDGLLDLKLTATKEDSRNQINIRISWQREDQKRKKKKLSVSTK